MQGLSVQIRVILDDGQYKWVVSHYNLNIIRLSGDSLEVSDGEVDPPCSLVLHEPNWHNIWLVVGWGIVRRGGGDITEPPDFVMAHGGAIGMAERGGLVANW